MGATGSAGTSTDAVDFRFQTRFNDLSVFSISNGATPDAPGICASRSSISVGLRHFENSPRAANACSKLYE